MYIPYETHSIFTNHAIGDYKMIVKNYKIKT